MTTNARIDPRSPIPLFRQVEADLRRRVDDQEWEAGERVPTESQLRDEYNVSRITIRQAMAELVRDGLFTRFQGRGTFLRERPFTAAPRTVTSFSRELRELGRTAGARVLELRRRPADAQDAHDLHVDVNEELWALERLRLADGRPVGVQKTVIVANRAPDLDKRLADDASLYALLQEHYGVVPIGAQETYGVGGVSKAEAPLLEVPPGFHAFMITRLAQDSNGIFERTLSTMRGDRYEITLSLNVDQPQ